jgi:hypothetical protein
VGRIVAVLDPVAHRSEVSAFLAGALEVAALLGCSRLRVISCGEKLPALRAWDAWARWPGGERIEWLWLSDPSKLAPAVLSAFGDDPEGAQSVCLLSLVGSDRRPGRISAWKVSVLEKCPAPVLVLPSRWRMQGGLRSLFVPMSGEARESIALDWAIRTASALGVPVDILHVASGKEAPVSPDDTVRPFRDPAGTDGFACQPRDAFHHEYPRLVEQFVGQASPLTSVRQKKVIRNFYHHCGDPLGFLLRYLRDGKYGAAGGMVVVEWKGRFDPGRARVLKRLLAAAGSPMLLLRQPQRLACSHLRVWE